MSLIVNTNVSSLTAQRSLAESASMLDQAMERLSSGSKINSASDDAAGLAIVQRMTSQINGLNMAVKNANDGIGMTQSVEGSLVEVSDMLQRLRELSVQAANGTSTDVDRSYIQEEVNLLVAEISRVSSNTQYNGQNVLDGSFKNIQLQVGSEGGETLNLTVDSTAANVLGAYKVTGDRIEAQAGNGAGSYNNITDSADDIIVNGASLSKSIDVVAADSAKQLADKINAVSGSTKVTAESKTFALLSSEYATDQTYSVLINNKTTGYFAISKSNVQDAVDKINAISGSTGVTATATDDNKVRLESDGSDILVENQSTGTALRVQSMGHDGAATMPQKHWHTAMATTANTTTDGTADGTYTLQQKSTGTTWSFTVDATIDGDPTLTNLENAINNISGVSGFKVVANASLANSPSVTATEEFGDFDIFSGTDITAADVLQTFDGQGVKMTIDADGAAWTPASAGATTNYILRNASTGKDHSFSVTSASATGPTGAELKAGLDAISGVGIFDLAAAAVAGADAILYGPADLGNFTLLTAAAAATQTTVNVAGDLNKLDKELAAGGSSNDAATVQGTIELSSSKAFSVTQSNETAGVVTDPTLATGSLLNDNYLLTQSAKLDTVSNVDLRSAAKAGAAIGVIDGAIEKISSMRAELGAVENRLSHTVSNLMNVAENTASAKSRINDADYSVESANLAKAQVLQQAGTAMLSQANARSQLVLQLLQ
jgi:flagellin